MFIHGFTPPAVTTAAEMRDGIAELRAAIGEVQP